MFFEPFTPISQPNNIRIEGKMMLQSEEETLDSWYSSKFYEFLRPSIFQCLPSFLKMWNDHFFILPSVLCWKHPLYMQNSGWGKAWLIGFPRYSSGCSEAGVLLAAETGKEEGRGWKIARSVLWYLSRKTVEKGNLLGACCRPEYHFYHL